MKHGRKEEAAMGVCVCVGGGESAREWGETGERASRKLCAESERPRLAMQRPPSGAGEPHDIDFPHRSARIIY